MVKWKKCVIGLAAILGILVIVALVAQAFPRTLTVEPEVRRVTGDDIVTSGKLLVPYRADYRRWAAVLGITIQTSTGIQTAKRTRPGTIDLTFALSASGSDLMRLREPSLVLEERSFGDAGGPGQDFVRNGMALEVTVRSADGTTRDLSFEYPVPVFEPSLLELPLSLLGLREGDEGVLAWSNFADPDDHWLPFRALERETIAAAGRDWDTLIVRVAFPDGRQRDYWLADEPPYKVRMVSYERGSLITTGWHLESLEVLD